MSISVLGAGAFGTALAISLAQKTDVVLWARNTGDVARMQADGENRAKLAGRPFPPALQVTSALPDPESDDIVLLAVPMQHLRGFLTAHRASLSGKVLVACCKGIELETGAGPLDVISNVLPGSQSALLTGPSFAADIAMGLPTALVLACADGALGETLQSTLSTPVLRLYRSTDVSGASLGGALKNVIAIAAGVAIGAKLGESARAALMTRGYAEMQRFALQKGARAETLAGLSGFGDLVLTCTSTQSRNYRLGLSIGQGVDFDSGTTVEGAATALAVHAQARRENLDLPIASAVAGLLENRLDVKAAMSALLSRSLKEE
jgi:glycerol-3-phosphate dehydrogenase (NAD(P)+)